MTKESILEVNDDNFAEIIKEGVVLIDFFAEWCGPCRMLAPILEEVADKLKGKVTCVKIDIDKNHMIAKTYNVTSVPTLILFKDNEETDRLIGLHDLEGVEKFVLGKK